MNNTQLTTYINNILSKIRNQQDISKRDALLVDFTKKFDKISINKSQIRVSGKEISILSNKTDVSLRNSLKNAAKNIENFHKKELSRTIRSWKVKNKGIITGQIINPVKRLGIYVPGGRFSYPSTVLMTAIPAKIAGVKEIYMVTPPNNITPAVVYAAKISGVTQIFRVGGPMAVAALAFGTGTIPKVDIIVGPGNKYVNEAKRQVIGDVGIDSLAGPSEVAIIADKTAKPEYIVTDALAQAEHDPDAKAYIYSDDKKLIGKINSLISKNKSFKKSQIVIKLCSIKQSIDFVNELAPEHLQIMAKNAGSIAIKIQKAGAIFVGNKTPTALGDYWAGPSHVLPTGSSARFSSGISVATYMKKISYIENKKLSKADRKCIESIALSEGLIYHKKSITIRSED